MALTLEQIEDRLKAVEEENRKLKIASRNLNPFESLEYQLALENGSTVSARERTLNISLGAFTVHTGSPIRTQVANTSTWAFDDAAAEESITAAIVVPEDYVSGLAIRLHYYMASATSGAVMWAVYGYSREEGDNYANAGTITFAADTVQGTAANLGVVDYSPAVTVAAGDNLRIRVRRSGSNGSDTASGDAYLVGVAFVYTAFF